jgi:hypothetical protein
MRGERLLGALMLVTATQGGGYYRMKVAHLIDQYGFGQPAEVARILIPSNWSFQGGVQWGPPTGCTYNLLHVQARAGDASGMYGFEMFSPYTWQWHDDPANRQVAQQQSPYLNAAVRPCEMRPAVRAVDFIRQSIVPRFRPGARILTSEALPQMARARQVALNGDLAQLIAAGAARGGQVDAGRVLITYNVNGRPVEEWISGMIEIIAMPAMSASAAMNGSLSQVSSYQITATSLVATRAPAGELSRYSRLYAGIVASLRSNPRYGFAVQAVFMNIIKGQIDGAAQRSAIWTEMQKYTGDIIVQAYQHQQQVQDQLAQSYSQSIRGTQTYYDPSARERVELTGGYSEAWSNGRGEYILSDDPNFDPSVALHEQWTLLQKSNN